MKQGLELEYWLIDEKGALTAPSRPLAELSFVEREAHPSLIEVKTDPHESLSELRTQLCDRLDRTLRIARADNLQLAPIGTALEGVKSVERNCRRGRRIDGPRRLSPSRARWIRRRLAARLAEDVATLREEPSRLDEPEAASIVLQ